MVPRAIKDPCSAFDVRVRNIRNFYSPAVGHYKFRMDVISGGNFLPYQIEIKIAEVKTGGAVFYRQGLESCHCT